MFDMFQNKKLIFFHSISLSFFLMLPITHKIDFAPTLWKPLEWWLRAQVYKLYVGQIISYVNPISLINKITIVPTS